MLVLSCAIGFVPYANMVAFLALSVELVTALIAVIAGGMGYARVGADGRGRVPTVVGTGLGLAWFLLIFATTLSGLGLMGLLATLNALVPH
jgi:hypothetical protein